MAKLPRCSSHPDQVLHFLGRLPTNKGRHTVWECPKDHKTYAEITRIEAVSGVPKERYAMNISKHEVQRKIAEKYPDFATMARVYLQEYGKSPYFSGYIVVRSDKRQKIEEAVESAVQNLMTELRKIRATGTPKNCTSHTDTPMRYLGWRFERVEKKPRNKIHYYECPTDNKTFLDVRPSKQKV